jgi:hypothetical protein
MGSGRARASNYINEDTCSLSTPNHHHHHHHGKNEEHMRELRKSLPDIPAEEIGGAESAQQPASIVTKPPTRRRSEGCLVHLVANEGDSAKAKARRKNLAKSMNDVMPSTSFMSKTSSIELQDPVPAQDQRKPSLLQKVKSLWRRYSPFAAFSNFGSTDHANVCQESRMVQHSHDMDASIIDMF